MRPPVCSLCIEIDHHNFLPASDGQAVRVPTPRRRLETR
jgi:hypothetical protein